MAASGFPADALVVRGGECAVKYMRINANKHHREHGEYALSAWCVPGLDAKATARHAREQGEHYMRQASMRAVTVGELEGAGYAVRPDEPPPGHVAIMLTDPLSDAELEELDGMLGPILENPEAP